MAAKLGRGRYYVEVNGRKRKFRELAKALTYANWYFMRTGVVLGIFEENLAGITRIEDVPRMGV